MHVLVGQQAFELGQNHTSTCSIACSSAWPRTGCPLIARHARSASVPRACTQPCLRAPISTLDAQWSALHSASRLEQELQLRRALPRPPSPPEPRPPRPAPSSHFQAAPVTRLASPVAREAFQVLGPNRVSPETQDRPRWTSVTRSRA
jgi:hypothetical protein